MDNNTGNNEQNDKIQAILFKKEHERIDRILAEHQEWISYFARKRNKYFAKEKLQKAEKAHNKVVKWSKRAFAVQ